MLKIDPVPVVIIGAYDGPQKYVEKKGGEELIPAVPFRLGKKAPSMINESNVDSHIDYRLSEILNFDGKINLIPSLIQKGIEFKRLLEKENLKEREIHDFLYKNPEILDPTSSLIYSEVSLGNSYRMDLLLIYENEKNRKSKLIELEHPKDLLFTKNGRPRAKLTHAVQQVEDWIRFWKSNPSSLPPFVNPEFIPAIPEIVGIPAIG